MASLSMISEPGLRTYLMLRDVNSLLWNTASGALESYNVNRYSQYAMSGIEQGHTGYYYTGTSAALPSGYYRIDWRDQVGSSGVESDVCVANGSAYWNMNQWNLTNLLGVTVEVAANNEMTTGLASGVWNMLTTGSEFPTNSFGEIVQLIRDDTNGILDGYESSSTTAGVIASGVWNMLTTEAGTTGSYSALLKSSLPVSSSAIADVIWDELMTEHQTAGTMGYALNVASGNLSAGTLTSAYDAAKTAASQTSVNTVDTVVDNLTTNLMAVSGVLTARTIPSGQYVTKGGVIDANIVSISGVPVNIDANSVADSDELSVLGNLLLRNARIIRLLP
jgi:hypothetical protein